MKIITETIALILVVLFLIFPWLAGFYFAKGVISTILCFFPFYQTLAEYPVFNFVTTHVVRFRPGMKA